MDADQVIDSVKLAYQLGYTSVVLQSGEQQNDSFIRRVGNIIKQIKQWSNGEIGITLSCGEQTEEVYRYWFECGAHRYLLRIETSSEQLYKQIHPNNQNHSFNQRIHCLESLRVLGYQVGTGMMIGLPLQDEELLADDLLFMKDFDIDMCGMGPYIEHRSAPLSRICSHFTLKERYNLSLKCVSILRMLMPDCNIAATTALQAIKANGREEALKIGANVIMPNFTPIEYRTDYQLYDNKPCITEFSASSDESFRHSLIQYGVNPQYSKWGDSRRFYNRKNSL